MLAHVWPLAKCYQVADISLCWHWTRKRKELLDHANPQKDMEGFPLMVGAQKPRKSNQEEEDDVQCRQTKSMWATPALTRFAG